MKCKDTIASLKNRVDGINTHEVLVPWSHYRTFLVQLTDGSRASLPICSECMSNISPTDFPLLSQQMRYELMRQQIIAYRGKSNAKERVIAAGKMCKTKEIMVKL